jgi:hypothetical protein
MVPIKTDSTESDQNKRLFASKQVDDKKVRMVRKLIKANQDKYIDQQMRQQR